MFAIGQSNFLQALGWAVINSLWQMALLWVVYQLATALFRKLTSSQKNSLAASLLFTGFGWFVFTFFVLLTESPVASVSAFITINGNAEVSSWFSRLLPIGSILYLSLLIFPVLNFIRNYRYVQAIRSSGLLKAEVRWRIFVQKIAAQMGIKKKVPIWVSEFVKSPVTVGYLKPIILLPAAAVNHLTVHQIEAVLLHELSHIRRFDYLVNLLTRIIQTVLYFNPFVKAFSKIIETEREKNCDEIVLQFQYEPYGYASALLALEKAAHLPQSLAVAASGGKKNELLNRIECILGINKKPVFSFNRIAGVVAALFCFVSLNAVLLLSKSGIETKLNPGLLTDASGPFAFISPEKEIYSQEKTPSIEIAKEPTINHTASPEAGKVVEANSGKQDAIAIPVSNTSINSAPFVNINYVEDIIPELDEAAEKQVEEALAASKKVMLEDQWKVVEKSIAEAMTQNEKEKLKGEYKKAVNKIDWENIQDKLKIAYEEINWNKVNEQLNTALAEIKLDSLQHAYSTAISNLSTIQKELKQANQNCIPDSDVTLKSLELQKKEVLKALNKVKVARGRKIVHL
ncbi:M56 family metallopeptidase [Terrimonas alba]|uniref:M56 family metallopeptidase n=1 Tax=Terrimonas alba TaxID=3349636 RepID=UPI0035F2AD42